MHHAHEQQPTGARHGRSSSLHTHTHTGKTAEGGGEKRKIRKFIYIFKKVQLRQWLVSTTRRGPQPRKVINVQRSSGAHPKRFGPRTVVHHEATPHALQHPQPHQRHTRSSSSSSSIRSQTEKYVSIERQLKHGFDDFITCQLVQPRRMQPPRTSLPQPGKEVATRYLSIKRAQRLQSVDVIMRQLRCEEAAPVTRRSKWQRSTWAGGMATTGAPHYPETANIKHYGDTEGRGEEEAERCRPQSREGGPQQAEAGEPRHHVSQAALKPLMDWCDYYCYLLSSEARVQTAHSPC